VAANDPGAAVTGAASLPRVVARGENDHLCFLIETPDDGRVRWGRVHDGARDALTQERYLLSFVKFGHGMWIEVEPDDHRRVIESPAPVWTDNG
jgi:hypothetical protein